MVYFFFAYNQFVRMFISTRVSHFVKEKVSAKQHKLCDPVSLLTRLRLYNLNYLFKFWIILSEMCQFTHYNLPIEWSWGVCGFDKIQT